MLNDFWHSSTAKCIKIFSSSFQSESYPVAGTTCATVLTQAILTEGCKSIAVGVNVMDLRRGINMAVDAVISDLKSKASMLSTPEEIKQVMDL
jgi:chaperonin GroEL (HSP60 family)